MPTCSNSRFKFLAFATIVILSVVAKEVTIPKSREISAVSTSIQGSSTSLTGNLQSYNIRLSAMKSPNKRRCTLLRRPHTATSPLVFLHIPKAGGTSVREALKSSASLVNLTMCAGLHLSSEIYHENSFNPIKNCRIVFGHLLYGVVDGFNDAMKPIYSILLRDPIERVSPI